MTRPPARTSPRDQGPQREPLWAWAAAAVIVALPAAWVWTEASAWPDARARAREIPPGHETARPDRTVVVLHPPEDGLITGPEVVVVWQAKVQRAADDLGLLAWRPVGEGGEFKFVNALPGPTPSARIPDLTPGAEYEYFVRIKGNPAVDSPRRRFRCGPGAAFTMRVFSYSGGTDAGRVPRADGLRFPVEIRNNSDRPRWVRATVRARSAGIRAGFVGTAAAEPDSPPAVIGPAEVWALTLAVNGGRARPGRHHLAVDLHQSERPDGPWAVVDRAVVVVELADPAADRLRVEQVGTDPADGAVRFRLTNPGRTDLPDLTVEPEPVLAGRASVEPAIRSAVLPAQTSIEFTVRPRLDPDNPPPAGGVSVRAAGKTLRIPVTWPTAPAGMRPRFTDAPARRLWETVCRRPIPPEGVEIEIDGPDGDGEYLRPAAPFDAAALRIGPALRVPRSPRMVPDEAAPRSPEAALGRPPVPLPVRTDSEPEGPAKPAPAKPRRPASNTDSSWVARASRMRTEAERLAGWTGAASLPAEWFPADAPPPAAWVARDFTAVLATEVEDGRRVLHYSTVLAVGTRRPLAFSDPSADAGSPTLRRTGLGGLAAGWVSGGRAWLRVSPDLGTSWSPPTDATPVELFAGKSPVRRLVLTAGGAIASAGALAGGPGGGLLAEDLPSVAALERPLALAVAGDPPRLWAAAGPGYASPTDLGPCEDAAVTPSGTGFVVVAQVPAEGGPRLSAVRLDHAARPTGPAEDLGPGRAPALHTGADGLIRLYHLAGPAGATTVAGRTWSAAAGWSASASRSGDHRGCLPPVAGVYHERPGGMFAVADAGAKRSGPLRLWSGPDGGEPVRPGGQAEICSAAWLAVDLDVWSAPPKPVEVHVRLNDTPVGTVPAVAASGTWILPLDPRVLRRVGTLGRHRLQVYTGSAGPGHAPVLCGARILAEGAAETCVFARSQADADARPRGDPAPRLAFGRGFLTEPLPTPPAGLRRVVLSRFSPEAGRTPRELPPEGAAALPTRTGRSELFVAPVLERRLPEAAVAPAEAAERYRITWLDEIGEPLDPAQPVVGSYVILRVECLADGPTAEIRIGGKP